MPKSLPARLLPLIEQPVARWLAAIGWTALIFFFSAQSKLPSPDDPWVDFLFKKSAHFTVYGILAVLYWRVLPPSVPRARLAWLLATLYAISDEYHQSFVANRHPAVRDVIIDACGAATALLLWRWLRRNRP
ncbi:MAG: VanZ family protein [Kouleothrix sp.]|jgi:VanZ family protein|nr:VanZ family protein [Kouleothrix sp.]